MPLANHSELLAAARLAGAMTLPGAQYRALQYTKVFVG